MTPLLPPPTAPRELRPSPRGAVGLDIPGERRGAGTGDDVGASDLHRYVGVLRRRWRLIAAVAVVVVAAVGVGTVLQTPVYRASGLMELRGQSGEGVPVEALFQTQRLSNQFLETQFGVLRSPALARRAIQAAGLHAAMGAEGATAAADSTAIDLEGVDAFGRRLIIDPVSGSNLVWVHFESSDPAFAARAVNAVFESYAVMRAEAARAAVERLATEVDSVRGRLTISERGLQDYVRASGLMVGLERGGADGEDLPHARLRILQQQLAEAEADRYAKQSVYGLIPSQGQDMLESEILQALNVRLATLRSEYARLRATYLDDYPRTREVRGQIDEVEALLAREQGRLRGAIVGRYTAAVRRQALLQRAVDEQREQLEGQGESATQYRILARDVDAQRELYAKLQERLRGAEVTAAVATTDVSVVEPAVAPAEPVRPVLSSNLQLALVVGLVLGLGVAYLREYMDLTVRTADDLSAFEVPLLGMIPSAPAMLQRGSSRTWSRQIAGGSALRRIGAGHEEHAARHAALKEAFLSLRAAVLMAGNQEGCAARTIVVTSARPGDGKTTIAVNLAISLGRLGRRVLLVDADMRRPAVHRAFGMPVGPGLGDVLRDESRWMELVHRDAATGLDVLLAGSPHESPTELLASHRPPALLAEAREAYDFVILDTPALDINAADSRILSSLVDGVVMVVRSGTTPRVLVGSLLRQATNVVGVVLNDVDRRQMPAYYYSYGEQRERAGAI